MTSYSVLPLTNPALIRAFLEQDRALTTYLLGDLDPENWPESEFIGALAGDDLVSVLLLYRGLDPTVITAHGDPEGVRAACDAVSLPGEMYTQLQPPLLDVILDYYDIPNPHDEWRMVLDTSTFSAPDMPDVKRIAPEQAAELAELYRHAAEPSEEVGAFSPAQIARGVFYGVWQDGNLVATAGTHVWSVQERVVAIGNVFTHPDHRGRGYATQCTGAVTRDAVAAGMDPIVLNVKEGNVPAIRVYEKLGFRQRELFVEGPGLRRRV